MWFCKFAFSITVKENTHCLSMFWIFDDFTLFTFEDLMSLTWYFMTILICSFLITSEAKHFFISLFPLKLIFLHISFSYFLLLLLFNWIISFILTKLTFICYVYTTIFFLSGLIFYFFYSIFYCEEDFNINIVNFISYPFRVCSVCVLF